MTGHDEDDRELTDLRHAQDADLAARRKGADRQTGRDRSQADRDIEAGRGLTDRRIAALRRSTIPLPRGGLRRVALLHPFEFPTVLCLLLLTIVFTVSPGTLEHSPVSFETRGIVHHVWHYTLLFGSVFAFAGLVIERRVGSIEVGLILELIGITLLLAALAMNFTALALGDEEGPVLSGLGAAVRVGVMAGFATRMWIIAARPTVTMRASRDA